MLDSSSLLQYPVLKVPACSFEHPLGRFVHLRREVVYYAHCHMMVKYYFVNIS